MEDRVLTKSTFKCHQCGDCCRNVNRWKKLLPALRELLPTINLDFPYKDNDGVCEKLTDDNKCSIFNQRPAVCNTKEMFLIINQIYHIDIKQLYDLQQLACQINKKSIHNNN